MAGQRKHTAESMSNKYYRSVWRQSPLLVTVSEPVNGKDTPIRSSQELALVLRVVEPLPQNCR